MKLETKTFFYDADVDSKAHYKEHRFTIKEDDKVVDVLEVIKSFEPTFTFDTEDVLLVVNGISIRGTLDVKKAVQLFGTSWTIEPISTLKAVKDLVINDDDFLRKHEVLASFADDEDFEFYKSLKGDYYASVVLKYDKEYMGDSMFVYAHHLIEKYPQKRMDILKSIDTPHGIWLYEKECNQYPFNDNDIKIESLKDIFPPKVVRGYNSDSTSYYNKAEQLLCKKYDVSKDEDCALETILDHITIERIKAEAQHSFDGFDVAFYVGSFDCEYLEDVRREAKNLIRELGANVVKFASSGDGDGFDIISSKNDIAYKIAGSIMLDAYDSGAEILVVDNKESHFIFDQCVKECEKAVGRKISIPVLNVSQFVALAIGITDVDKLGLDEHKIKPNFL